MKNLFVYQSPGRAPQVAAFIDSLEPKLREKLIWAVAVLQRGGELLLDFRQAVGLGLHRHLLNELLRVRLRGSRREIRQLQEPEDGLEHDEMEDEQE